MSASFVAFNARPHQRRVAVVTHTIWVGASLQQRPNTRMVAFTGLHQRRLTLGGGDVRVGSRLQQRLSASLMAVPARKQQRRTTCVATARSRLVSVRGKLARGKLP